MKKVLLSFAAAVLAVGLTAVSASAAEAQVPDEEMQAVTHEASQVFVQNDFTGLTGSDLDMAMAQALREAGWDVVVESPQTALAALDGVDQSVFDLAYSDLESASPEQKAAIRAAREKIIYSSSWSADDSSTGFLVKAATKEIVISPRFQDLFPGWEVPGTYSASAPAEPEVEKAASQVLDGLNAARATQVVLFNNSVPLRKPSSTSITPAFYNAPTVPGANIFTSYANLLVTSANYNLGYTSPDGASIKYWGGIGVNEGCVIANITPAISHVGVRVSTNSQPGSAWMVVKRETV